ncbi:Phenylalanyl-tRNA synthetase, partial [Conglomerata obtusa]
MNNDNDKNEDKLSNKNTREYKCTNENKIKINVNDIFNEQMFNSIINNIFNNQETSTETNGNDLLALLKHTPQVSTEIHSHFTFPLIQTLASHNLILYTPVDRTVACLTSEGVSVIVNGSPEFNLYTKILDGMSIEEARNDKIPFGHLCKNKWVINGVEIVKEGVNDDLRNVLSGIFHINNRNENFNNKNIRPKVHPIVKPENQLTFNVESHTIDPKILNYLKKRKLIEEKKSTTYIIEQGSCYQEKMPSYATELTASMITTGSYKDLTFKPYNFDTQGIIPNKGNLHPLLKVKEEFRKIFLSLGFSEMQSGKYVESSFWNFDVLFQPQQHPSRDAHDTFFVKNEVKIDCDKNYLNEVKRTHESGGYGSTGYKCNWDVNEAQKGCLRTHTTAISARYLHKIAQIIKSSKKNLVNETQTFKVIDIENLNIYNNKNTVTIIDEKCNDNINDGKCNDNFNIENFITSLENNNITNECFKLFSIDKVFRNESLDATHLPEFHQIEGVV